MLSALALAACSSGGDGRTPEGDVEAADRSTAGLEWIGAGLESARSAGGKGIVLLFQADGDVDLDRLGIGTANTEVLPPPERESTRGRRPVPVVHGDTHVVRVHTPLTAIRNVTRSEDLGSQVPWSRVAVDREEPRRFPFSAGIARADRVDNTPR